MKHQPMKRNRLQLPWIQADMTSRDLCKTAETLRNALMRYHDVKKVADEKGPEGYADFFEECAIILANIDEWYEVTK